MRLVGMVECRHGEVVESFPDREAAERVVAGRRHPGTRPDVEVVRRLQRQDPPPTGRPA